MRSQSARARTTERVDMVVGVLRARGIEAALDAAEDRELVAGVPGDALMEAALSCTDAADFRLRVREQDAAHGRPVPDR